MFLLAGRAVCFLACHYYQCLYYGLLAGIWYSERQ